MDSARSIVLQGFNWTSHHNNKHYNHINDSMIDKMKQMNITKIWLPPSSKSRDPEGYYPLDYYDHDSAYGTKDELKSLLGTCKDNDIDVMGELVCWYDFCGHNRTPYKFNDIEYDIHSESLYDAYEEYLLHMKDIGFTDIRMDFLKSKECYDLGLYVSNLKSVEDLNFVGEYWTAMNYEGEYLMNNQNNHRQEIVDYIDKTHGKFDMFDFTLKGVLQEALNKREYWRLCDERNLLPGVNGWYASNAVTFIDNHDTLGQHLWAFSHDKDIVVAGYAYIMTHPGTPCIYYDHFFDLQHELLKLSEICSLITNNNVTILEACNNLYKAKIGNNIIIQIGRYSPEDNTEILFQTNVVLISLIKTGTNH